MKHQRNFGFTLIELMVVIAIISILATVSAPTFEKHIAKANLVDVQLYGNELTSAVDEFVLTHAAFPSDTDFSDFKPDHSNIDLIKAVSLSKLDTLQGSLSLSFAQGIGINENQFIKYSRTSSGIWVCETSLSSQLIPEKCTPAE